MQAGASPTIKIRRRPSPSGFIMGDLQPFRFSPHAPHDGNSVNGLRLVTAVSLKKPRNAMLEKLAEFDGFRFGLGGLRFA